jgi:peptidoglycan/LPS O-acetylase OafA/YrhL
LDNTATVRAGRIEYIDGIRGVASLMVAIQHPLELAYPGYARWSVEWVNAGRVGIVAFFLVSGYVVGLTLSKQTPRVFAVRRFWRLYPIYWVATIAYVATVAVSGQAPIDYSLFVIAINVTMLQGFIGVSTILGVAWTLGIEVAFYVQSIFGKLFKRLDWTVWFGVVWLAGFGVLALSNFLRGTEYTTVVPLMMFTASLGFALYLWEQKRSVALVPLGAAAVAVVSLLGWFLEYDGNGTTSAWTPLGFDASYLLGLMIFGAFYLARDRDTSPHVLWLGEISYALYLIHTIVMIALVPLGLPGPAFVFATVALSLVVAAIVNRLVEGLRSLTAADSRRFVGRSPWAVGRRHRPQGL